MKKHLKNLAPVARGLSTTAKKVFKKYQADHANIMVSSIAFYILLTFIPFTLFSFFILGYVIDVGHTGVQMEKYIARAIPAPYNAVIVKKVLREINVISLSKRLSGPLGLLFLLLFTSRLFAVLRPSFQLIFGKTKKGFIKGKQEEFVLTFAFALIQTIIFFSYVFSVMMQVKVVKAFGGGRHARFGGAVLFRPRSLSCRRDVLVSLLCPHARAGQEEASLRLRPGGRDVARGQVLFPVLRSLHRAIHDLLRHLRRLHRLSLLGLLLRFCFHRLRGAAGGLLGTGRQWACTQLCPIPMETVRGTMKSSDSVIVLSNVSAFRIASSCRTSK